MTDQPLPLKPWHERLCEHCGGLVTIRMPVPSSGCDHLYYPDYCEVCRAANPSEMDKLNAKIQEQAVQLKEYEKRFKNRGHAFQNAQNKSLLKIQEQAEVIRIVREALDNTVAVLINYPELGHLNWLLNKLKEALDRVRGGK